MFTALALQYTEGIPRPASTAVGIARASRVEQVMPELPLSDLGNWLLHVFDDYGYAVTFVGALFENTALLGAFMPGGTLLLLAGAYAKAGSLQWPVVLMLGWAGVFVGNNADYWLGRRALLWLLTRPRIRKRTEPQLVRARRYFDQYGAFAIFGGHFFGQTRSFIALAAGSTRYSYSRYVLTELAASLVWSAVYVALGYVAGANLDKLQLVPRRLGLWGILAVAAILAIAIAARSLRNKWRRRVRIQPSTAVRPR